MPTKKAPSHIGAMFDIRPVNEAGHVNVDKIAGLTRVVNLARPKAMPQQSRVFPEAMLAVSRRAKPVAKPKKKIAEPIRDQTSSYLEDELEAKLPIEDKPSPHQELESLLNQNPDIVVELARVGGSIQSYKPKRPKPIPVPVVEPIESLPKAELEPQPEPESQSEQESLHPALSELHRAPRDFALPELEVELATAPALEFASDGTLIAEPVYETQIHEWMAPAQPVQINRVNAPSPQRFRISKKSLFVAGAILLALAALAWYGLKVKNDLVKEGESAVASLESAQEDIKNFNFESASQNFVSAYEEFAKAGETMNVLGPSLMSVVSGLPGGEKLKSAQSLVEVGKLMADAGAAMTQAFSALAQTNLLVNPTVGSEVAVGQVLNNLKTALAISADNTAKAEGLMAKIDFSILPEDKRGALEDFKSKIPNISDLLTNSVQYAKFLESFVDVRGSKRYLILFQNPSELRPNGGFAGTYGILSFKDGRLKEFKVDDIYNPDGQLKERIIPPKELQHITPTLAMRDVSWFVDFPTSARKVMSYYKKETGEDVDGVVTLSPKIVARILEIVGPVAMPEYSVTLNSQNFLAEIQEEVEYGKNRIQPKSIVMDFAPRLLEKLYSADSNKWLAVFNALIGGLDKKDVMLYSRNISLQSFAMDQGFAGGVARVDTDYFMATFTNVKGSKTDVVTDNGIKISTKWQDNQVRHKVTLTRTHTGGRHQLGFYNKQNPAYVRVLVPEGSQLVSIQGQDTPNYRPLVDYTEDGFQKDEDIARFELEASATSFPGVVEYKEAGKTEFGFWLITDPGQTKSVTFEYTVPQKYSGHDYKLYIQKQPGLEVDSFEFSLEKPFGAQVVAATPVFSQIGETLTYQAPLEADLPIRVEIKRN